MSFRPTPRSDFQLASFACVSVLALTACGGIARGNGSAGSMPTSGAARVERRELDHHPPINLVVRQGDPEPALAFASVTDRGAVATVAVSALVLARLREGGITDVVSVPSANGFELSTLCADAAAARAFIERVTSALATPLAERDAAAPAIVEALSALRSRTFAGPAEANLAACSGELGVLAGTILPDPRNPAGRAQIEQFREAAFAARASAFAALGPEPFVDDAASALGKAGAWPSGDEAEDPWPVNDSAEIDTGEGVRRLGVALRVPDAARALGSLASLGGSDADLALRLRTFAPAFTLDRLTFTARPRGACLRADLSSNSGDQGPSPAEAALGASLVADELGAAYASSSSVRALDDSVIEPSDPREAAARAARRALTSRLEPGNEKRAVALRVHTAERAAFNSFSGALKELETRPPKAPLETRIRAEAGQGELWLLAGSPCGTLAESDEDVGQSALAVTLAAAGNSADVKLEPWITTDAVGVLAHSARKGDETPIQQAERVARALARALSTRDASGNALTGAQTALFSAIGGTPRPGYTRLLDALSPDHIAWLEPRGTLTSLLAASRDTVAARARDLLHGPLRIAVLANENDVQAKAATRAFERWLAPFRDDPRRCQTTPEHSAHGGEISFSVNDDSASESAYVAVPFNARLKYDREAEAVAELLNTENGRLARAVASAHVSATTRASVIGGDRAAALVIEVRASDDEARRAVLEVRRVLERLAQSPFSGEELLALQHSAERRQLAASLDPRRRIVDLWRGAPPAAPLTPASVRAFQAILNPSAEVVVYVSHRD